MSEGFLGPQPERRFGFLGKIREQMGLTDYERLVRDCGIYDILDENFLDDRIVKKNFEDIKKRLELAEKKFLGDKPSEKRTKALVKIYQERQRILSRSTNDELFGLKGKVISYLEERINILQGKTTGEETNPTESN